MYYNVFGEKVSRRRFKEMCEAAKNRCLAPDFLDTELSVFMQRLQVQEVAGEPGLA